MTKQVKQCDEVDSLASENPMFDFITPWEGQVPAGFDANVLGQLTDVRFSVSDIPEFARVDRFVSPKPPRIDAEACEWRALFEAIKDARDRRGQTALMLAAMNGDTPMVGWLIEHDAELDHTAKFGLSKAPRETGGANISNAIRPSPTTVPMDRPAPKRDPAFRFIAYFANV